MSSFGSRIFNKTQALEKEVKDLYLKFTVAAPDAATATLDLTADITLTSVATGTARNTSTFTVQVLAAAANPTNKVLVAFTGTAAAIICTVTPNDGTNNAATPVNLTTAELVTLINNGSLAKVTLTDTSSRRALQTASGGDTTALADAGEGDGVVATFANGTDDTPAIVKGMGFSTVVRNSAGDYTITLQDKYSSLKHLKASVIAATAVDLRVQIHTNDIQNKIVRILTLTGATPTDAADGTTLILQMDVKNSGQPD